MKKELKALERIKEFMSNNAVHWKQDVGMIKQALEALEIIKESIGIKMSIDNDDIACLFVPIVKTFEPLDKNIVIVGFVQGKDKIDLLKEVLL